MVATLVDHHPIIDDDQLMAEMLSKSEEAVAAFYALLGAQRVLLAPPIESARNMVDFIIMGWHEVLRRRQRRRRARLARLGGWRGTIILGLGAAAALHCHAAGCFALAQHDHFRVCS